MDAHFETVALVNIQDAMRRHLRSLPSAIDSFLETYILDSTY